VKPLKKPLNAGSRNRKRRGDVMSDKVPTYEEWLKERQNSTNENRARAEAYRDTALPKDKGLWTWFLAIYQEINMAYNALSWASSYQLEGDSKILQIIRENQTRTEQLLKTLLGLDGSATEKDIEVRAKEFGGLVDNLIEKKKDFDKVTRQMP